MMESLIRLYGPWGEHPQHPVEDWKYAVANDDTRLGYWAWVAILENIPEPGGPPERLH